MPEQPNALTPEVVSAILRDPDSGYFPAQITVFCDACGIEHTADYMVSESMTKAERLDVARQHLTTNENWQTDGTNDYCPDHARTPAAAPTVPQAAKPCDGCGHPAHPAWKCSVTNYGERCACDEPITAEPASERTTG